MENNVDGKRDSDSKREKDSKYTSHLFFWISPANTCLSSRSHALEMCKLDSKSIIYLHFIKAFTIMIMSLVFVHLANSELDLK